MILSAPSLLAAKPETEAQIKMREALRVKMEELNTQEKPPAPPVATVPKALEPAPVVETPKPTPMPVVKPEVKPVAPKPVKVKAEPAKPKTVVVPVPVEAPVAAPAKVEFSEPVSEAESAAAVRMKEALQKKMAELDATPAPVVVAPAPAVKSAPAAKPQPKVVVAPEKPAPAKPVAPAVTAAPVVVAAPAPAKIEAPASPLPVTKQDRLAELLRRYKADQVNAQEYHSQRAAILAE
jgi:ribonuclease E